MGSYGNPLTIAADFWKKKGKDLKGAFKSGSRPAINRNEGKQLEALENPKPKAKAKAAAVRPSGKSAERSDARKARDRKLMGR